MASWERLHTALREQVREKMGREAQPSAGIMTAKVHAADIMDREGVMLLVDGAATQFPRLRHVWLDAGYNGKGKGKDWIETTLGWIAKIVQHNPKPRYIWLPN